MTAPSSHPITDRGPIVVAMSGGVDSSMVAALLTRQGYETIGITLQLYDHGGGGGRKGACCAGRDVLDARRVADALGIPHYVLDFEERFHAEVMEDFAAAYRRGETPLPCARCNERVKFTHLLAIAEDLGAQALATGHYVRRLPGADGDEMHRARDLSRDQSYFLFSTNRSQLARLRFPLGGMTKAETRAQAQQMRLPVADKPDSQDICFVPRGRYDQVIEALHPGACEPGDIVHVDGRVLGRHGGIVGYTIGQRRGLGIGGRRSSKGGEDSEDRGDTDPLFVVSLNAAKRQVVVGPRSALETREIRLRDVNWLGDGLFSAEERRPIRVKLRSNQEPVAADVSPAPDGGAWARFPAGIETTAPGQACVFYARDSERMLGGGWIAPQAQGESRRP